MGYITLKKSGIWERINGICRLRALLFMLSCALTIKRHISNKA